MIPLPSASGEVLGCTVILKLLRYKVGRDGRLLRACGC